MNGLNQFSSKFFLTAITLVQLNSYSFAQTSYTHDSIIYSDIDYSEQKTTPGNNPSLVLDIRSTLDDTVTYYVILAIRENTLTGHAFAEWGIESPGEKMRIIDVYGFYPSIDNKEMAIGTVAGKIKNDIKSLRFSPPYNRIAIEVDHNTFLRSQEMLRSWKYHPPSYSLTSRNCIDFYQEVGKSIGIKMPSKLLYPTPRLYMNRLIALIHGKGLLLDDNRVIRYDGKICVCPIKNSIVH